MYDIPMRSVASCTPIKGEIHFLSKTAPNRTRANDEKRPIAINRYEAFLLDTERSLANRTLKNDKSNH